jgi:hypothetical protein
MRALGNTEGDGLMRSLGNTEGDGLMRSLGNVGRGLMRLPENSEVVG